jgi:hypothetical protein
MILKHRFGGSHFKNPMSFLSAKASTSWVPDQGGTGTCFSGRKAWEIPSAMGIYWNILEQFGTYLNIHIYIYITYGIILEHMCYYILWLSYVYIYVSVWFDFGKRDKYHVDMRHISRRHNLLNLQMQHVCSADCRSWKFENTQTESDNKTC